MELTEATETDRPHTQECRRDESGLTTLEWLLIVAAVAGLAALAVVLVTNVVSDTSEDISGQSARLTAARTAALEVTNDARAETAATDPKAKDLNATYKSACNRIKILYGDAMKAAGPNAKVIWSKDISGASPSSEPTPGNVELASDWDASAKTYGCWLHVP
jgi:Tfp pilus assembly protein FimT